MGESGWVGGRKVGWVGKGSEGEWPERDGKSGLCGEESEGGRGCVREREGEKERRGREKNA